jgi:hypothetical protein
VQIQLWDLVHGVSNRLPPPSFSALNSASRILGRGGFSIHLVLGLIIGGDMFLRISHPHEGAGGKWARS